jgi:hypothetical protein
MQILSDLNDAVSTADDIYDVECDGNMIMCG